MRTIPRRKVLAEIIRGDVVIKIYDMKVLEKVLKDMKIEKPTEGIGS